MLEHFTAEDGTLYDTADDAEELIRRPQDPTDNATPSGWTAAAGALLSYAAHTGSARHREAAERALGVVGALAGRAPRFIGWGLAVAEAPLDGPREVAVVGPAGDPGTAALHRAALLGTAPGAVVAVGEPGRRRVPAAARPRDAGRTARRRTSAAASPATCRSPTRRHWRNGCAEPTRRAHAPDMGRPRHGFRAGAGWGPVGSESKERKRFVPDVSCGCRPPGRCRRSAR